MFFLTSFKSVLGAVLILAASYKQVHSQCGVVGATPGVAIQIPNVSKNTPVGTEIWRSGTYNVGASSTSSNANPHVKYLDGFRLTRAYYFKTTSNFPNFIKEQGLQILTRNVTFKCITGETVEQNFETILDIILTPQFLKPEYKLEIKKDWPLNDVKVNQGTIIVAEGNLHTQTSYDLQFPNLKDSQGNEVIKVEGSKLWPDHNPPPNGVFFYRVDLFLISALAVGDYTFEIIANSPVQTGRAVVKLTVNEN